MPLTEITEATEGEPSAINLCLDPPMRRSSALSLLLLTLAAAGPSPRVASPDAVQPCLASTEAARAWYQRYTNEVWNRRNLTVAANRWWAADFRNNYAPRFPPGPAGMRQQAEPFLAAFSELRFTVDDVAVDDDRLMARITIQGRHTGTFAGIEPTLREVTVHEIAWYRVQNCRFAEIWPIVDVAGLMAQLRGE